MTSSSDRIKLLEKIKEDHHLYRTEDDFKTTLWNFETKENIKIDEYVYECLEDQFEDRNDDEPPNLDIVVYRVAEALKFAEFKKTPKYEEHKKMIDSMFKE
jgi:hypothetical protein